VSWSTIDIAAQSAALVATVNASGAFAGVAEVGFLPVVKPRDLAPGEYLRVVPVGPATDLAEGTRHRPLDRVSFRVGACVASDPESPLIGDPARMMQLTQAAIDLREYLLLGPKPTAPDVVAPPWRIGGYSVDSVDFALGEGEAFVPEVLAEFGLFYTDMDVVLNHPG